MKIKELNFRQYDRKFVRVVDDSNLLDILKLDDLTVPFDGYMYIDGDCGVTLCILGNEETKGKYLRELKTIARYRTIKECSIEVLEEYPYQEVVVKKFSKFYDNKSKVMVRNMKELDQFRYEANPDDLECTIDFEDGPDEKIWVRIFDTINNGDVLVGTLLSSSSFDDRFKQDKIVAVKYFEERENIYIVDILERTEFKSPDKTDLKKIYRNYMVLEEEFNSLNKEMYHLLNRLFETLCNLLTEYGLTERLVNEIINNVELPTEKEMLINYLIFGNPESYADIIKQAYVINGRPFSRTNEDTHLPISLTEEEKQALFHIHLPYDFESELSNEDFYINLKLLDEAIVQVGNDERSSILKDVLEKATAVGGEKGKRIIAYHSDGTKEEMILNHDTLCDIAGKKIKIHFENGSFVVGYLATDFSDEIIGVYEAFDRKKGFHEYNAYYLKYIREIEAVDHRIPRFIEDINFNFDEESKEIL